MCLGEGSFALIMGIVSGYPIGGKIVANLKEQGLCTDIECERLIAFTNNSGPLFIIGTVGASLFYDTKTGIVLFITHILACITVGILFRNWKRKEENKNNINNYKKQFNISSNIDKINMKNLGDILTKAIVSSINTITMIGGFVVLFSVVSSIIKNSKLLYLLSNVLNPILYIIKIPNIYSTSIINSIIELTNGIYQISLVTTKTISINIILCAFFLGFGGLSILLQVLSITSKSNISIKPYIIGKILQAFIAALYTYLILIIFPFLSLDLN